MASKPSTLTGPVTAAGEQIVAAGVDHAEQAARPDQAADIRLFQDPHQGGDVGDTARLDHDPVRRPTRDDLLELRGEVLAQGAADATVGQLHDLRAAPAQQRGVDAQFAEIVDQRDGPDLRVGGGEAPAQERRLAATRRADQCDDFLLADLERNMLYGMVVAVVHVDIFGHHEGILAGDRADNPAPPLLRDLFVDAPVRQYPHFMLKNRDENENTGLIPGAEKTVLIKSGHRRFLDLFLDLDAAFRQRSLTKEQLTHGVEDGHWNPAGHRVVAEILHQFLLERSILK